MSSWPDKTRLSILVRPLEAGDVDSVVALADAELGRRYITVDTLSERPDRVVLVAEVGGTIAGFAVAYLMDARAAGSLVQARLPEHVSGGACIAVVRTVAVDAAFQGRGVGSALTRATLNKLASLGCEAVLAVAWSSKGLVNAASILERAGLVQFAVTPNYWEGASLREGFECRTCGAPPCLCSAALFTTPPLRQVHALR